MLSATLGHSSSSNSHMMEAFSLLAAVVGNCLLGRLFDRVDLIKPVSNVRTYVHTYVHQSTKSFFDFHEIWHFHRGRRVMHGGMQYDQIKNQGCEPFKVGNPVVFKSCLLCHLQWELATDHGFLNYGTVSKFDWARFLVFGLMFVSRDFEVGTDVNCKETTIISPKGLIFCLSCGCVISYLGELSLAVPAGVGTKLQSWEVNRQTTCYTSSVSILSQCLLLSH